jgi:hypothetical protein
MTGAVSEPIRGQRKGEDLTRARFVQIVTSRYLRTCEVD